MTSSSQTRTIKVWIFTTSTTAKTRDSVPESENPITLPSTSASSGGAVSEFCPGQRKTLEARNLT